MGVLGGGTLAKMVLGGRIGMGEAGDLHGVVFLC